VPPERQFVDDGISGATLVRPALDRLRDLATVGAIDKVYVHSPDRLARNYAYQVLLLDECELAATIGPVLADANWHRRREINRILVQKVEIGHENIKIVFRLLPEAGRSETQSIAVTLPR
jgi:site-specific DNA recombinase